ncbi:MAG: 23S rRNA (uracil(1939)-C(5))-methyltransferase RlmD [Candidatus Marinimicrobia bacterium]|nr:23S rRNA (uracil(1939)-C(5))-methyltransferase RlmD [Candidatus Neomarinimicrobiota bacterium]
MKTLLSANSNSTDRQDTRPVRKNQILELKIDRLAFGGAGIARVDDYIIFVGNEAVPGQIVSAQITQAKSTFAEAKIREIIQPGDQEIPAPCPYFHHCGGCKHQNIPYKLQTDYFHRQIVEIYQHLGQFDDIKVQPTIPSEKTLRYRNKMEFAFSNRRWRIGQTDTEKPENFALGLRVPGNYMKAIDIDDCLIAPEETPIVLRLVRTFALENHIPAFDTIRHDGFLRHLVLRKGEHTGNLMINIVTHDDSPKIFEPLIVQLSKELPNLVSVVNTVTRAVSGTTMGEKTNLLFGQDSIEEKLGNLSFKISPASFFQTNTGMAEKLYETIQSAAGIRKTETVWDLYCGTGSIALFLAESARQVIGFEIVPSAIQDAMENASRNGIDNARFIRGDLDQLFRKSPELLSDLPAPDVLVIDPPRVGMHPKLVQDILPLNPSRIIYVSCNPSTQVRDLKTICQLGGYHIEFVRPIDLFPHTPHIEVVTKLTRF